MIVTPRVRAEVQAHFNCPELEGAELEDQGEDGTALTHWEKRVFEVRNVESPILPFAGCTTILDKQFQPFAIENGTRADRFLYFFVV